MKEQKGHRRRHRSSRSKHDRSDARVNVREAELEPEKQPTPESDKTAELIAEKHTDEEIVRDLPKRYHPIRVFVDDRPELLEQLFETVKGAELQKILPETLKSMKLSELKRMCSMQLENMSRDLILHILDGGDSLSYQEDRTQDTVTSSEQDLSEKPLKRKADEEEDLVSSTTGNFGPSKRKTYDSASYQREDVSQDLDTTSVDLELGETAMQKEIPLVESIQKPVGELLELEMRARAIRSFLKAKGFSSSEDEEETGETAKPNTGKP